MCSYVCIRFSSSIQENHFTVVIFQCDARFSKKIVNFCFLIIRYSHLIIHRSWFRFIQNGGTDILYCIKQNYFFFSSFCVCVLESMATSRIFGYIFRYECMLWRCQATENSFNLCSSVIKKLHRVNDLTFCYTIYHKFIYIISYVVRLNISFLDFLEKEKKKKKKKV